MKMNKVKSLTDSNQLLTQQLKSERSAALLLKSQYEDALKHEKDLLEEARTQIRSLSASASSEIAFISNRMDDKNAEILTLTEAYQSCKHDLNEIQDDNLNLKSQLSTAFDELNLMKSNQNDAKAEAAPAKVPTRPTVYLIGTSNIHGINAEKLTPAAQITKFTAYTLEETSTCLSKLVHSPDVIVLHV